MKIKNLLEQRNELNKEIKEAFIRFGKKVEEETGLVFLRFTALEEEVGDFQYYYMFALSSGNAIEFNIFYCEDEVEPFIETLEEWLELNKEFYDRDYTEQEKNEIEKIYRAFQKIK